MKKENLDKLLFALINKPNRGDRDSAKNLHISQPAVARLRKTLEAKAIQQCTVIPKSSFELR
jgi:hypothetical protein